MMALTIASNLPSRLVQTVEGVQYNPLNVKRLDQALQHPVQLSTKRSFDGLQYTVDDDDNDDDEDREE